MWAFWFDTLATFCFCFFRGDIKKNSTYMRLKCDEMWPEITLSIL